MHDLLIEHRLEIHAMQLAPEQGLLQAPAQWTMNHVQQMFEGVGDFTGMAYVKAGV